MLAASTQTQHHGWQAGLTLGFQAINQRTVLAQRQRHGPLAVQRPFYPEGEVCHVYLLHPPGGVVGGDQLNIQAGLAEQAHALITTPGATKFYRSAGQQAVQKQTIKLADKACIEWFPQENIFFPGAEAKLQTRVELTGNARLAMWDMQCFGRPSINEAFDLGHADISLHIWQDGQPILIERLQADRVKNTFASTLRGQAVNATFLMNGADSKALDKAREFVFKNAKQTSAATLIEDVLIVRYLGNSTEMARKLFVQVWSELRQRLIGKPASIPRIWHT